MVLITGGACQGKEQFAREWLKKNGKVSGLSAADGGDADIDAVFSVHLLTNFHLLTARLLREGRDPSVLAKRMARENPDLVVTVNELGCGIVPIDAFDRNWREATGRACCILAAQSDEVYRMICGIAVKIKG